MWAGTAVGIVTRYGLDGRGSNLGEGEIFRIHPDRPWVAPASYTTGTGSFQEAKRPRRGVDHPPPSTVNVKERVEVYLYSPSGPSWLVVE